MGKGRREKGHKIRSIRIEANSTSTVSLTPSIHQQDGVRGRGYCRCHNKDLLQMETVDSVVV